MNSVNYLKIENFRGIETLEIHPKTINLIVGPNNTGKSSILQALALIATSVKSYDDVLNNNIFSYLFFYKNLFPNLIVRLGAQLCLIKAIIKNKELELRIENLKGLPDDEERADLINKKLHEISGIWTTADLKEEFNFTSPPNLSDLIKAKTSKDPISISLNKIINDSELLAKEDISYFIKLKKLLFTLTSDLQLCSMNIYPGIEIEPFGGRLHRTITNSPRKTFLNYLYDEEEELTVSESRLKGKELKIYENKDLLKKFSNINSLFYFYDKNILENLNKLHDKVVKLNKIEKVFEILKSNIPYFSDIRKTESGLKVFLAGKDAIPLSSMGDGFILLLTLTFISVLAENGIIILEEPEVSLHPGYMDVLTESILLNSKNTQFFISTHSEDLIKEFLALGKRKDMLDQIEIIRLHGRLDQTIDYEELDGETAKSEIEEIHTDLRGI